MCVNPLCFLLQGPYNTSHKCSSQYTLFLHIRISCSASPSSAWCRGAAWFKAIPSLSCLCGQALDGGMPCSLCVYRAQKDSVKSLALERCSDFTSPAETTFPHQPLSLPHGSQAVGTAGAGVVDLLKDHCLPNCIPGS